ncbi:putative replication initiation protein [Acinetobacter phage Abp95]|nr:putative replication initiation protein [Acinetobacter phage Abp95]
MSNKLIEERAILLFPSLAKDIGLNNAIFLQQLHFWCDIANELGYGKLHDGQRWVYKTAQEWHEKDFPFWSVVTIRRIINNLHDQNLIHAMYLDDDKWNRTLFYRINYMHELFTSNQSDDMQVINLTTSKSSKRSNASNQNDEMLSENTAKITSKITTDNINKGEVKKFDPIDCELPSNVDKKDWIDFVEMRKSIKKPLSELAAKKILNKLESFGVYAKQSIENSIVSSWADVYLPKRSKDFNQPQNNRMQELQQLSEQWELENANYTPY